MSQYTCSNTDCTVAMTGKCLLSHDPVDLCPNISVSAAEHDEEGQPTAVAADSTKSIHHGLELGPEQVGRLFAARYGHLIGVLGATGTGKTCLLSSLYLLASCGELRPTYSFAGSATLPGFEGRLRLLRKWTETRLPDQIVDHTTLEDPRQPGFLHLALVKTEEPRLLRDLVFTDLPGEWTTDLIRREATSERLRFLRRADAIIIALPSPQLLAKDTRNSRIQMSRMLFQRLRDSVRIPLETPVILAITRCDETGKITPEAVYSIVDTARELGFSNVSYELVAAFSDRPEVPSGMGVPSIVDTILRAQHGPQWEFKPSGRATRFFARYRFVNGTGE